MKTKGRKWGLALLCLCFAASMAFITACSVKAPNGKPNGTYEFDNPPTSTAETDADVTVDGNFDEAFYAAQNTHWYDYAVEMTAEHTVRVRAAVHFGQKGSYIAVDVDDAQVNFNAANRINYNSGMEIMLAADGATNAVGNAYRFTFSAGGQTKWEIYSSQLQYAVWDTPAAYAPRAAIALKGGEIGAGCTGYKAEIFIPNKAIAEESTPSDLNVFLCAIASYSSAAGEQLRAWKGLNIEQKIVGTDWDNPSTWLRFNESGFVADTVAVTAGEGGTATYDYDYTLNGMRNGVTIVPDAGYRLASFKRDGREVSGRLATENGVSRYDFTGAGRDTEFAVTFEAVSSQVYTVSGSLSAGSFTNAPSQSDMLADIAGITLQTATVAYPATVTGSTYTVSAPAGKYTLRVRSARGFTLVNRQIGLSGNVTENIVLDENAWLGRNFVQLNDCDVANNAAYDSIVNEEIDAKTFTFGGRIAVPFGEGRIVPEVRFNYDADRYVRVQLMNWDGTFAVKLIVAGCADKTQNLTAGENKLAYANRLRENGGFLIVTVNAETGAITVYLDDGSNGFGQIVTQTANWLESATLTDVHVRKTDDALSRTVRFGNNILYTNCAGLAVFTANCPAQMNTDLQVGSGVEVAIPSAKAGEQRSITVTASADVGVTVSVNGAILTGSVSGNTRTYTFTAYYYNDVTVVAYAKAAFTATVQVPADMETLARVEARPTEGGDTVALAGASGSYSADLVGAYELWAISASGFGRKLDDIAVRGEAVSKAYTVQREDWTNGILSADAPNTEIATAWTPVWQDEDAEIKGPFAVAFTLDANGLNEQTVAEWNARLYFNVNQVLRIDFQYNMNNMAFVLGAYTGVPDQSTNWKSLNNVQNKFAAVYKYVMTEKKLHVILSVNAAQNGWKVYLWNGFEYREMTDTNTTSGFNEKFENIAWLQNARLAKFDVKRNGGTAGSVTTDGAKIATGAANVTNMINTAPTVTAELTVNTPKDVAEYPAVSKLTVKIADKERDLTGGKITLACGTYEVWAYTSANAGRKIGTVTMNGTAKTETIALTAQNWGTLTGKQILDAAAASGYGQEQKIFEQAQTGALRNFALHIDFALNAWNGSKGDATVMGNTFTAVVVVNFGNNKYMRVNLVKQASVANLEVQQRTANGSDQGAAQNAKTQAINADNGFADLCTVTNFGIDITVQNGKATVSVLFGSHTVTVSDYDLTNFLTESDAFNFAGVRKTDSTSDLVITVNSTIAALPARAD